MLAVAMSASLGAAPAPQQAPTRDAAFVPTTGTATISGAVVNDEDPAQPVRRAVVTLTGPDLRPSRGAVTDDAGRFTIANLPAGRFTLTVSRASYVTSVYGAKRPGRPGTPLSIAAGASITGLTVRLWRGAVVAGVVRDPNGAPVPRIPVTTIPAKPAATSSILTLSNNGVTTNEQGEFRIFGLAPGAYVVVAKPSSGGSQIQALRESEVDALLESLRRRTPAPAPVAPAAAVPFDYAAVYYPAATSPAQATVLRLAPGQEVTGLDLTLMRVATAVVSGVVTLPDGRPAAGASVQLSANVPDGPFKPESRLELNATADAEGRFRIVQAAPGVYQIMARAAAEPPPPSTPGIVTPGPVGPQLWASAPLSIGASNVEGLALNVTPGFTITGRVQFQSDVQKPPVGAALRIFLLPSSVATQRPGTAITTLAFVPPVTVRPDGTFDVVNLPPGTFRFQIIGPVLAAGGWVPRSAVLDGRDLLDADFTIPAGSGRGEVTVTLTDKVTELSGVLQMASGAPVSDVFVIAYAADRSRWGPGARRVQAVRPAVDGRYSMSGLPPGDYLLAAVLDVDQDDWNDPVFLEQVPASIKLTLGEGDKKTQHVRINQ
jgi:hypothetical protein